MENRSGQLIDFTVSPATGTAEWEAVPELLYGVWERGKLTKVALVAATCKLLTILKAMMRDRP